MHSDSALTALVEPVVNELGLQLWGIEVTMQGRAKTLCVYIDRPQVAEVESGVQLADCEAVSRQLSSLLDVEDIIAGEYTLEVSSPGVNRPLYTEAQFARFIDSVVKVKLRHSFDGRRKYQGLLRSVENDEITLLVDQEEYILPLESVDKANVVYQF